MSTRRRLPLLLAITLLGTGYAEVSDLSAQVPVPTSFGWEESLDGEEDFRLRWPTAVASDATDEIAVLDASGPSFQVFKYGGPTSGWKVLVRTDLPTPAFSMVFCRDKYLASPRQRGKLLILQAPEFNPTEMRLPDEVTPGALACTPNGDILVHDLSGERVLLLENNGRLRGETPVKGFVAALAPGSGNGFLAAMSDEAEIRRFGADGEILATIAIPKVDSRPAWPSGLVVESDGEILVTDRHGGRVLVLDTGGRLIGTGARWGWEPGLLRFPAAISPLPNGRIAIADLGNGRVQIFQRLDQETSR